IRVPFQVLVQMSDTPAKPKWYAITLDRVLIALLLVEGLLFLSDQYDWFAFNRRKGWTVLIAVAVASGVLLLTGLWTAVSWGIARWTRGKPFQFGLRSGLLLVLVFGLVCGWLGAAIQQAQQQADICAAVVKAGGYCDLQNPDIDDVPDRLLSVLRVDFF